jgi:hypothetical protein
LEDLQRATALAGPSKFVVHPWYLGARLGSKLSFLFGKFPMAYTEVAEEIMDLMRKKKAHMNPSP